MKTTMVIEKTTNEELNQLRREMSAKEKKDLTLNDIVKFLLLALQDRSNRKTEGTQKVQTNHLFRKLLSFHSPLNDKFISTEHHSVT